MQGKISQSYFSDRECLGLPQNRLAQTRKCIFDSIRDSYLSTTIQNFYLCLPLPSIRTFYLYLPLPTIRNFYLCLPLPTIRTFYLYLPLPTIRNFYLYLPLPPLRNFYLCKPLPTIRNFYLCLPLPTRSQVIAFQQKGKLAIRDIFEWLIAPPVKLLCVGQLQKHFFNFFEKEKKEREREARSFQVESLNGGPTYKHSTVII